VGNSSARQFLNTVFLNLPTPIASIANQAAKNNQPVNIYRKTAVPRRRRETVVHCSASHAGSASDTVVCAGSADAAAAFAPVWAASTGAGAAAAASLESACSEAALCKRVFVYKISGSPVECPKIKELAARGNEATAEVLASAAGTRGNWTERAEEADVVEVTYGCKKTSKEAGATIAETIEGSKMRSWGKFDDTAAPAGVSAASTSPTSTAATAARLGSEWNKTLLVCKGHTLALQVGHSAFLRSQATMQCCRLWEWWLSNGCVSHWNKQRM
jgi:hypothetical protein